MAREQSSKVEPVRLSEHANSDRIPSRWAESDRFVPRVFVRPVMRFAESSVATGSFMLAAAVLALLWANSPWYESYDALWHTYLKIELGDLIHLDHLDLRAWVNDGLMAIFFFVMAMEIKRELIFGHLRDRRAAIVPAFAALGGMVVPAGIYLLVNAGGPGSKGWGIPMATDIAFAVGVVALLGDRVPSAARVFLLSLAIVDDIGAILVIAIFYTEAADLSIAWLLAAVVALGVIFLFQKLKIRSFVALLPLAVFVWLAVHESGVHATIAGVVLGLMTPAWAFYDPNKFGSIARPLVDRIQRNIESDDMLSHEESAENEATMNELIRLSNESMSPLQRNLFGLEPWVNFVIVPLFAFANAGVRVVGGAAPNPFAENVSIGIILGLLVGKTLGVTGATAIAVRSGLGTLPVGTNWRQITGLAVTSGIGFTVALFVANLAFDVDELTNQAKVGVLVASGIAGVLGFGLLRSGSPSDTKS